jgi:MFS transporter, OFA family, oxalate/formate antiporter
MVCAIIITASIGSWHAVFYIAAAMNAVAAIMALAVLRPMRVHAEPRAASQ